MKAIIVGGGDIGKDLARDLAEREDNEITVIEKGDILFLLVEDDRALEQMKEKLSESPGSKRF